MACQNFGDVSYHESPSVMKRRAAMGCFFAYTGVRVPLLHFPLSHAWAVLRPCILYKMTLDASCLDYVANDSRNFMHSFREVSPRRTWAILLGACDVHVGAGTDNPFNFLSFPY